jgi:hypothetical protein
VEPQSSAASWEADVEIQHTQRRASDRHSNDRPEADISSMRQLITDALRNPFGHVDTSAKTCKGKRQLTDMSCKLRAYYWQSLLIRQAWRWVLFFAGGFEALNRGTAFPNAPDRRDAVTHSVTGKIGGNSRKRPTEEADNYWPMLDY